MKTPTILRLTLLAIIAAFSATSSHASCMWSILDGFKDLGTLGDPATGQPTTVNITPSWNGSTPFDTTRDGCVLFFGGVGASGSVIVGSTTIPLPNSTAPWQFYNQADGGWNAGGGNTASVVTDSAGVPMGLKDPYSTNSTLSGPGSGWGTSWIVARNSKFIYVIKVTGSADPQIYNNFTYYTKRTPGSISGVWGWTDADVTKYPGDYADTPMNVHITGPYNGFGSSSRNHYSLLPLSLFQTNAFSDFLLPDGNLSVVPQPTGNLALISWDKGTNLGIQSLVGDAETNTLYGRNLITYWNSSVGDAGQLNQLNIAPADAGTAANTLMGLNPSRLASALGAAASGAPMSSTTISSQDQVTGSSTTSSSAAGQWNQEDYMGEHNLGDSFTDRGQSFYADHHGYWKVDWKNNWSSYTTTTVTDHNVSGVNSVNYTSPRFLVVDSDTGQIISAVGASAWGSYQAGSVQQTAGNLTPNAIVGTVKTAINGSTPNSLHAWSYNYSTTESSSSFSQSGWWVYQTWSPLTISLSGKADFLSGEWRKVSRPVNWFSMRPFNLDGSGTKLWEWVGPTEGILVWNPEHKSTLPVTGKDFFSLIFNGGKYNNGFEALQSIVKPGEATVSGDVLKNIYVWTDKSGNAVIKEGELLPLSHYGITSLSLKPYHDDKGGLLDDKGAVADNGKSYPLRDWWSQGGVTIPDAKAFLSSCASKPSLYQWAADDKDKNPFVSIPFFRTPYLKDTPSNLGGSFRFDIIDGGIRVLISRVGDKSPTPMVLACNVTPKGELFGWDLDMGHGEFINTRFVPSDDLKSIYGVTNCVKDGKPLGYYTWTATRSAGPLFTDLAAAMSIIDSPATQNK